MTNPPQPAPQELQAAADTIHQAVETAAAVGAMAEARPNDVVVLAVKGIIITTVLALLGAVGLILDGGTPPDGVIAIASAGIGSLSTLLTVRGVRGER